MKKKWYIVEQGSPEDNSFFLIQATKDEFLFLRKVLRGYMKIHPEGFNTPSEAQKVFAENYRGYKGVYHD